MQLIIDKTTGEAVYMTSLVYRVIDRKRVRTILSEDAALTEAAQNGAAGSPANWLVWTVPTDEEAEAMQRAGLSHITVTMDGEKVAEVVVAPYTPPEPPTPIEDMIADLKARIDKNLQVSPHDRRWLEQKEIAKEAGITYIKAHPDCTMDEMEAALQAEVAGQFPGEPVVVGAGLIMSYADEAQKRGYIPEATWDALKALVAGATEQQLRQMLNKL